jgi:hypothetical protein
MTQTMIDTTCRRCGVTFQQANDPGRKRQFCGNACRQADYRARAGKTGHEAAQERARKEQERREQDARRARERRAKEARDQAHRAGADWTAPNHRDTPAQARARAMCRKLMDRAAHVRSQGHEADLAREKAAAIRAKHGL